MSAEKYLVTGATGATGHYTVQRLVEKEYAVRALVHKEDERSEALRGTGAEVVVGDLLEHDDAIRVTAGTSAAYFCYPLRPGLIQASAYFADAAKRAGLVAVVNMSQISAREDSKSHAARDHWIAERVFDWVRGSGRAPPIDILCATAALSPFVGDHCRKWHHRSALWRRPSCTDRGGGPG